MKPTSIDLRERILAAYDAAEGTRQEIADRFKVSLGLVKKLLTQRKTLGTIEPQYQNVGRKPAFDGRNLNQLNKFLQKRNDSTLMEIQEHFSGSVLCSIQTIANAIKRLGWRYKKTLRANEQGREDIAPKRWLWKKTQPSMDFARLVFIDESGAKTNMTRLYGRAMAGQRAIDDTPSGHWCTETFRQIGNQIINQLCIRFPVASLTPHYPDLQVQVKAPLGKSLDEIKERVKKRHNGFYSSRISFHYIYLNSLHNT